MKTAIASLALLALVGSQTLAAETTLPAGKPSGVTEAQRHSNVRLWATIGVGIAVAAGIGIALANGDSANCGTCAVVVGTTPTTSTTTTTG